MFHSMRILSFAIVFTAFLAGPTAADHFVGDFNRNCAVDFADVSVLIEQWLDPAGSSADLNGDDRVDMADFAIIAGNWSKTDAPLVISEFMASNASNRPSGAGDLLDENGDSSDWVEIYNPAHSAADLAGNEGPKCGAVSTAKAKPHLDSGLDKKPNSAASRPPL